jgi:hypothetical protein
MQREALLQYNGQKVAEHETIKMLSAGYGNSIVILCMRHLIQPAAYIQ